MKKFSTLALGLFVGLTTLASNAFAADPAWFTDLNTNLAGILVMAGTALTAVISIKLVPLAWGFVKQVLSR